MSVVKEFREFIARGNVIDLAVGIIIGGAFGSIVKTLVDQVVMPPIGLVLGNVDFSRLEFVLRAEDPLTTEIEKVAIGYGAFINTIIQFLIVAAAVFLLVKLVNSLRRQQAEAPAAEPAAPTPSEALLAEIRDLLKTQAAAAPKPRVTPVASAKAPTKPASTRKKT